MKRAWVVSFDGGRKVPWIARPDKGAEIFFGQPDSLVRFLVDGGLDAAGIRTTFRTIEAGAEAMVTLADRKANG